MDSAWEQKKLGARKLIAVGAACCAATVPSAGRWVGQRYYIPLFPPQEFIGRRLLEKRNPWLHHLDRYVEGLLGRL